MGWGIGFSGSVIFIAGVFSFESSSLQGLEVNTDRTFLDVVETIRLSSLLSFLISYCFLHRAYFYRELRSCSEQACLEQVLLSAGLGV